MKTNPFLSNPGQFVTHQTGPQATEHAPALSLVDENLQVDPVALDRTNRLKDLRGIIIPPNKVVTMRHGSDEESKVEAFLQEAENTGIAEAALGANDQAAQGAAIIMSAGLAPGLSKLLERPLLEAVWQSNDASGTAGAAAHASHADMPPAQHDFLTHDPHYPVPPHHGAAAWSEPIHAGAGGHPYHHPGYGYPGYEPQHAWHPATHPHHPAPYYGHPPAAPYPPAHGGHYPEYPQSWGPAHPGMHPHPWPHHSHLQTWAPDPGPSAAAWHYAPGGGPAVSPSGQHVRTTAPADTWSRYPLNIKTELPSAFEPGISPAPSHPATTAQMHSNSPTPDNLASEHEASLAAESLLMLGQQKPRR